MDYAKALRVSRAMAGLQQKELASRAGMDPSNISLIETGKRKPSLRAVEKLSQALGIPHHLFTLLATEPADLRVNDPAHLKQAIESLAHFMLNNDLR